MTLRRMVVSTATVGLSVGDSAGQRRSGARRVWAQILGLLLLLASGQPAASERQAGSLCMAAEFESLFSQILARSPRVRRQHEHLAEAKNVRIFVSLVSRLPGDRLAQTVFRPAPTGGFDASIEILCPQRVHDYAELLAHEFEHVLEQLEGVNLARLSRQRDAGVSMLADGSFETQRAIRAGRQASRELLSGVALEHDRIRVVGRRGR